MKITLISVLAVIVAIILSLPGSMGKYIDGLVLAQTVKETTFVKRDGSTIVVRTMAPAEIVEIEPYIDAKKGKEKGTLYLDVVIKNTAGDPQPYRVFGQGKTDTGGRLGGMSKAPGKGKVDPGKEVMAKIKTGYEGKTVPDEMRLDVFSPQ
jgi:hypothetical protein